VHILPVAANPFGTSLAPCVPPTTWANECKYTLENFPGLKEIFFDDDTFNYRKARAIELCNKLGPLNFTWSCTSRVTTDYGDFEGDERCRMAG